MMRRDTIWQSAELTRSYLEGVRGAIPLAAEQLDLLLRVAAAAQPAPADILDLGCGDGVLASALLDRFPAVRAVLLDFSQPMLAQARLRLAAQTERVQYVEADYGDPSWVDRLGERRTFQIIVSGFSIHHQPDARKRALYAELYELLTPGGVFLNLEHVASASAWLSGLYDQLFIDSLHAYANRPGYAVDRAQVAAEYDARPDKAANLLAPVELQCVWLRDLGFVDVDCYLKVFELALFGGRRPDQ
jgi:ubiquinone/menaquinone biosynthesis C-methylase UbiE